MKPIDAFIRYRKALHDLPQYDWNEEVIKEFEEDKKFFNEEYEKNRHISFTFAAEQAHIKLFERLLEIPVKTKSLGLWDPLITT